MDVIKHQQLFQSEMTINFSSFAPKSVQLYAVKFQGVLRKFVGYINVSL